ncbi:MAG: Hpt domain-containing protein [Planctomycetota bacterium]|jgi:HPt (histidine-containing phosphotransfer) domain-containing protein
MTHWLDHGSMENTFESDPELVVDLVQIFRDLHPGLEASIEKAIGRGDFSEVRESAHLLKTRLWLLHLPDLGKNAEELEQHALSQRRSEMMLSHFVLKRNISEALTEIDSFLGDHVK